MARRRQVERARDGSVHLRLPVEERTVLRSVVAQLKVLVVADGDPSLVRLYPTAYNGDPKAEAEFQALVHDDLVTRRVRAIDLVEATIDADRLEPDQVGAWMDVVNDIRLVLGTRLEISEDLDMDAIADDHADIASYALYSYLSWLLEQFVVAVSER